VRVKNETARGMGRERGRQREMPLPGKSPQAERRSVPQAPLSVKATPPQTGIKIPRDRDLFCLSTFIVVNVSGTLPG
jgi:hypothetical protein